MICLQVDLLIFDTFQAAQKCTATKILDQFEVASKCLQISYDSQKIGKKKNKYDTKKKFTRK